MQQTTVVQQAAPVNLTSPVMSTGVTNIVHRPGPFIHENYNGRASLVLGVLQLVTGCLCIIFNVVGMVIQTGRAEQGEMPNWALNSAGGIWCAAFFLTSGGLAVGAAKNRTGGLITANLTMSIFSLIFALILLIIGGVAFGEERNEFFGLYTRQDNSAHKTSLAMAILMMILSVVETVASITAMSFAGSVVCCTSAPSTSTVITTAVNQPTPYPMAQTMAPTPYHNPQNVYAMPPPQQVPYYGQQPQPYHPEPPPTYRGDVKLIRA